MDEYPVTECPDHGVKVAGDEASAVTYRRLAHECRSERDEWPVAHDAWHVEERHECWVCCDRMTINGETFKSDRA